MRTSSLFICLSLFAFALSGCYGNRDHCEDCDKDKDKMGMSCNMPKSLIAVMTPTAGNKTSGTVKFMTVADGVRVVADITGLKPASKHAIHIHALGNISAADGTATGGHYNPGNHPHAGPDAEHRHAGDLGNLTADAAGKAHYELVAKGLSLCCGSAPIIGRAVIIHAKADDFATQPTGNAGPRIAQGVIGVGEE